MTPQLKFYYPEAAHVARQITRTASAKWPDRERALRAGFLAAADAKYVIEEAARAAQMGQSSGPAYRLAMFGRKHAARLVRQYGPYEGAARAALGLGFAVRASI